MHSGMDVDITHAADGCITIAPVTTKRNNTAKFEDSYTKDGRVYFRFVVSNSYIGTCSCLDECQIDFTMMCLELQRLNFLINCDN